MKKVFLCFTLIFAILFLNLNIAAFSASALDTCELDSVQFEKINTIIAANIVSKPYYTHYFIFKKVDGTFRIILHDTDCTSSGSYITVNGSQTHASTLFTLDANCNITDTSISTSYSVSISTSIIVATNYPVYVGQTTEIFFIASPLQQPWALAHQVQAGMLQQVLTSILGLLPFLAILLVGLLAFWKAWVLLLQVLRQA